MGHSKFHITAFRPDAANDARPQRIPAGSTHLMNSVLGEQSLPGFVERLFLALVVQLSSLWPDCLPSRLHPSMALTISNNSGFEVD